jgi:uncharacterized protein
MRCWALFLVLLVPSLATAQINTLPSSPHLLVKGHAEARYVPDRFIIHLTVDVTNMSPNVARGKVEAHIQQLFKSLDANGALKDETHASSLSIQPETDYRDGKSVFSGTDVSRTLDATFDSLDKLRAFITQVPADKEVQISSVDVARSDMEKIKLELRRQAIENSKKAAAEIAASYGMALKGVYSVSEVAPNFAYGIQAGSWANGQEISVTGGHPPVMELALPPPPPVAALRVGTMTAEQDIYAVYLTEPQQ